MALIRYSTDPLVFDLPPFTQGGTTVNRRAFVTDFDHNQAAQAFTLSLSIVPFERLADGDFGAELTAGIFRRSPDQLQATMLRITDEQGLILAERYKGATATDAEWAAFLAQLEADDSVQAAYQYELFRKWCKEPQVIDNLIAGFVLQAYAPPAA